MAEIDHRPGAAARLGERFAPLRTGLLVLIAVILAGWALRAIGAVAVPVVFAFFLTLVVAPVDRWVSDRAPKKARWLGHVAAMLTILLVLAVFVGCLWLAAQQMAARFSSESGGTGGLASLVPDMSGGNGQSGAGQSGTGSNEASGGSQGGSDGGEGAAGASVARGDGQGAGQGGGLRGLAGTFRDAAGSLTDRLSSWASGFASTILSTTGSFLSALILVFFLTLLMLVEAPRWQAKLAALFDGPAREETFDATAIIAERLRRFLLIRVVVGLITAVLYVGWLWTFGVDLLLVWGLLTVLLNFVPAIGSLISGILPVIYAFVTKDFGTAVMVGLGILVIEQAMGNYVDPRLQGRTVSLSALVILIALLFWGWIWGVAGAFLAVPMTITFLVIGAHVPALRPVALLLSNETDIEGLERSAGR